MNTSSSKKSDQERMETFIRWDEVFFNILGNFKAQPIRNLQGKNIQTGELAAIKVIKIESGDDFQQIEQEILMLRSCQHKNIIRWDLRNIEMRSS